MNTTRRSSRRWRRWRGIGLVDRFEAMRDVQRERGDMYYMASDNLHLNDRGHRCMAEQLARAIVAACCRRTPSRCSPSS